MASEEDNGSSSENDHNDEVERTEIRAELSNLSFEELQKLKERIGAKVYNEAIFGNKSKKSAIERPKVFKRENKNRPREMSSKKPVPMISNEVTTKSKKKDIRDPRFDPLCGEFDKKQFSENYKFLSDVHTKDIKAIRAELKRTTDPELEVKLRRLLQRLTDKARASKKREVEKEKQIREKAIIQKDLVEGKPHCFMNKSERRVEALVKQYEELKSEGASRVQRHLMRRQQKLKKRSHRAPTGVS